MRHIATFALLLLASCSDADVVVPVAAAPTKEAVPLPAPAPPAAVDPVKQKVLDDAAVAIQADIERLRGERFLQNVPVKLADKATLVEYLKQREAMETSPERERFREESYKLLGLAPATMDVKAATHAFLQSQVGGFYDPPTKSFYVMDSFEGELARVIMSHEFVHALDDQLYDLDGIAKRLGQDTDALLAFSSVCEGSGMYTMTQWMFANAASIDQEALIEFQKLGSNGTEDLPPMIWKPMLAAYTCGQAFVGKGVPKKKKGKKDAGGEVAAEEATAPTYSAQLAKAFLEPPRSTEQILHPEKYWSEEQRDEPQRVVFDARKLPEGWKVLGEDTLGEIALALLTTPLAERKGIDANNLFALANLTYTNPAAKGWDGDRLILLGRGEDRLLGFVTVWDTEEDAKEFEAAIGTVLPLAEPGSSAPALVPVRKSVAVRVDDPKCVVIDLAWARDPKSLPDDDGVRLPWSVR